MGLHSFWENEGSRHFLLLPLIKIVIFDFVPLPKATLLSTTPLKQQYVGAFADLNPS